MESNLFTLGSCNMILCSIRFDVSDIDAFAFVEVAVFVLTPAWTLAILVRMFTRARGKLPLQNITQFGTSILQPPIMILNGKLGRQKSTLGLVRSVFGIDNVMGFCIPCDRHMKARGGGAV